MRILVLGAAGQTGSYVAEKLQLIPTITTFAASRSKNQHFNPKNYIQIDPSLGKSALKQTICELQPDWIVNMVSLSSVFDCERDPTTSLHINFEFVKELTQNILESQQQLSKQISLFQCSSSEMYSNLLPYSIVDESTELNPGTTYGIHKARSLEYLREAKRKETSLSYASGIFFNHESPRRSDNFVSMKIVRNARAISKNRSSLLELGDTSVERDWSYAPDFADGIIRILTKKVEGEFVFASGELHSIDEFCQLTFEFFGVKDYKDYLKENIQLFRKNNNNGLIGNSSKLRETLDWHPTADFRDLVRIMSSAQIDD